MSGYYDFYSLLFFGMYVSIGVVVVVVVVDQGAIFNNAENGRRLHFTMG